ncbi:response regulator [uncultured Roseivirga sp.]|uniref:hybrid sensor histidine kinase/response regulator n=1 Tax=uncultured Roseivirga sp. TaxID=543088 RepID=UPI0030DCCFCF|tara:strand:+ start:146533 stop:147570 length:1038 start_codon:yes stop_codon:yes gene_type:complete
MKILLIEDNENDIFLIKEYLRLINFSNAEVTALSTSKEVREILKENTFDLALLDLTLPDTTGISSFESLMSCSPEFPIIVLTGLEDQEIAKEIIHKGAQDYLVKGVYQPKDLMKSIEYSIERYQWFMDRYKMERKYVNAIIKGAETERTRIARDLHDGVVQTLTISLLTLDLLIKKNPEFIEKNSVLVDKTRKHLKNSVDEVRNIAHSLIPNAFQNTGLKLALSELMEDIRSLASIKVDFKYDIVSENISEDKYMTIYRVIQEIFNNMIKHAQATECLVSFTQKENVVNILIKDNGRGFDLDSINIKPSFGIDNIQSRVNLLNGTCTLDSKKGEGTSYEISFPMN